MSTPAFTRVPPDAQPANREQYLIEATRVLGASLDYRETLRQLARLAVPVLADWCAVFVPDERGALRVVQVAHEDPDRLELAAEVQRRFPPDPGMVGGAYEVFQTGKSTVQNDVTDELLARSARDDEHARMLRKLGLRASLIVPLSARGRRLGVLALLMAESGRRFSEDDVAFAEDIATRAALAVDNARLYSEAEQARREAERREQEEAALRDAAEVLAAAFTMDEVMQQLAARSLEATQADGAFVERLDATTAELIVVAVAGEIHPELQTRVPYAGSLAQRVIERGQPEIIRMLGEAPYQLPGTMAQTYAGNSSVTVPLMDGGEAIGALVLIRRPATGEFTDDEVARAHTFGNLAALSFRKVSLLEDSERRRSELQEVMESRTRLVRGFSHDLKNPLGAADGHAALLEDGVLGELTPAQLKSVQRIRAALRSAVGLINDLVELARAEAGQLRLSREPVDVREVARELAEHYRPAAEQAGLALDLELVQAPLIESDTDRIRQILGNLLSNAVKYTERGGRVLVRTGEREHEHEGEACVIIEVVDTGVGIPEDKHDQLFREFARIDSSKPGAGLGLAISRRIARLLGGDISFRSQPGVGSTFTLWLPPNVVS